MQISAAFLLISAEVEGDGRMESRTSGGWRRWSRSNAVVSCRPGVAAWTEERWSPALGGWVEERWSPRWLDSQPRGSRSPGVAPRVAGSSSPSSVAESGDGVTDSRGGGTARLRLAGGEREWDGGRSGVRTESG